MALTDGQKKIIEDFKKQFEVINSVNDNLTFNILDGTKLKQEANRIAIGKKELIIIAGKYDEVRKETILKIVNQLNEDFKKGDLPLEAENYYGYKFYIQCGNENVKRFTDVNNQNKITVEVEFINEQTEFGNKCIGLMFKNGNNEKQKFLNIKDLLNNENTQRQLLRLIEKSNENINKL